MYADELGRKYTRASRNPADETSPAEQVYNTNEGPVLIVTSGKDVFVSESFDLTTARKLQILMLGAQQASGQNMALNLVPALPQAAASVPTSDLAGSMVRLMAHCGMMRAALPHHLY